ncbi:MAG TPA: PaaI family thioesterase [Usitatibacter sp.]|jgi:uncharacterized protein (TIGR00369 family)|nr:PaaI family thioesterase [Usitatibacter sp.]
MSAPVVERTSSGLEYLQRIIRGEIPGVPIGVTLGFRMVEVEKGRVALLGNPDQRSYNLIGSVHGGWAAAILDSALALSTLSSLEADQGFTTVDIRINYLRPITMETGEVRAEGRVLQGGRRLAYSEAKLTDRAGKLLAHGTGSCLILPRGQTT